jgi:effector-binding domain-containing protein
MAVNIFIETVTARTLAAVRRKVHIEQIGAAWRPALDQVWQFLSQHPGLRSDGHNIFLYHHPLYHHPANRREPMDIDFGVHVTRSFPKEGDVFVTETPAGRVATALHVGHYERLGETHDAIHAWAAASQMMFAGKSWGIYGDWSDDPAKLETRVEYLLV